LVRAVVTSLVFGALLDGDGNVTLKVVSSGAGVEVKVVPARSRVEAEGVEFVSVSNRGVGVVAIVVVVSSSESAVSTDVGRPVSVVDVDVDVSGSFWDPDLLSDFSELGGSRPFSDVWSSDWGNCSARGNRGRSENGFLSSGGASGHGGEDGVRAGFSVVRRPVLSNSNVEVRTWGDSFRVDVRAWEDRQNVSSGGERVVCSVSARERGFRSFRP
jgi:hypothetical protein